MFEEPGNVGHQANHAPFSAPLGGRASQGLALVRIGFMWGRTCCSTETNWFTKKPPPAVTKGCLMEEVGVPIIHSLGD